MTILKCATCTAMLAPAPTLQDFNKTERFYCIRNPDHIWKANGEPAGWTGGEEVPLPLSARP